MKLTGLLRTQRESKEEEFEGDEMGDAWHLSRARTYAGEKSWEDALMVNFIRIGAERISGDVMNPGRGITARMKKPSDKVYFSYEDVTEGSHFCDGLVSYCILRGEEYTLEGNFFKGNWTESASGYEIHVIVERAVCLLRNHSPDVEAQTERGASDYRIPRVRM